ncbi:MAG: 2OG-Fe(II) oxygenase [Coleofasciculaceae cyanobacterium]
MESYPVQDVKVTILLTGGHQHTLYLKSNAPLLQSLLKAVVTRSQKKQEFFSCLFQIPSESGRAALYFPSDHLVALMTEPPLNFQQTEAKKPQRADILPSNYVQFDNFLTRQENKKLLDYVEQQELNFAPNSPNTGNLDIGKALIINSSNQFSELIINRVKQIFSTVVNKLEISPFPVWDIENHLTAHNNGDYYKVHNDNGSPKTASRELSYIYYFHKEPKPFSGGELLIYDSKIENNFYVKADSFKKIEPRNNSIVFFLSRYLHEALPVTCPSKSFADSHFTINGWIRCQS